MYAAFQSIREMTAAMKIMMLDGRMDDFLRLLDRRHDLLEQLARQPRRSPECEEILQDVREQDESWALHARQTASELQGKIRATNKKRSDLGRLAGAYAGSRSGGTFVVRHG